MFSKVYRGNWRTKDGEKIIAVKRFYHADHDFEKSLELLSNLKHENILTIYVITKENDKTALLLMEYADCGTIQSVLHGTETKLHYSYLDALKWMHQCVQVHFIF